MAIYICSHKLFAKYLVKNGEILAFSLGTREEQTEKQLLKIRNFHKLPGSLIESEELDREFNKKIHEKLKYNHNFINDLGIYKFVRVYKELLTLNLGETISYKELASKTKLSIPLVVRALKYNPFPILIPCHRVIRSDGSLSGYTPLGPEFKKLLLDLERK